MRLNFFTPTPIPVGLNETIDDRVAALLQAGTHITLVYDDTANTLTINSTGGGGGGGSSWGSITGSLSSQTDLQSALDDKAPTSHNHTGTYQPAAAVLTNTTASFTTALETKLNGIATGATANSSDGTLYSINQSLMAKMGAF